MNIFEYVKWTFNDPTMTNKSAEVILWGCTGWPSFLTGEPMRCLTKQLRHAKRSLARGFTVDQIYTGEDNEHPTT